MANRGQFQNSIICKNSKSEWRKNIEFRIKSLLAKYEGIKDDKELIRIFTEFIRDDPLSADVIEKLQTEIHENFECFLEKGRKLSHIDNEAIEDRSENKNLFNDFNVAEGKHGKISNCSALVELKYDKHRGRYLQAKDHINPGDILIVERPYVAVPTSDNTDTYCSNCFERLKANYKHCFACINVKYCSQKCRQESWESYHHIECFLMPLLKMLDVSSHLAMRILLVTSPETIIDCLQAGFGFVDTVMPDCIPGCDEDDRYTGDYRCVRSLVTNAEYQPITALVSYILDAVLMSEVAFPYIYGEMYQDSRWNGCHGDMTRDMMAVTLLHHLKQMQCNIHAITTLRSTESTSQDSVYTMEQKRIAAAIYPTVSLMNHSCDPNVIVSFVCSTVIIRASRVIKAGNEISHCYGPVVGRMTREKRQELLRKQYFFTCNCTACKCEEDLPVVSSSFDAMFVCRSCSGVTKVSRNTLQGKCQNIKCCQVGDFSQDVVLVEEAAKLFDLALVYLERDQLRESLKVLKKCLEKRENVLHKFDKDFAQTHDVLARLDIVDFLRNKTMKSRYQ